MRASSVCLLQQPHQNHKEINARLEEKYQIKLVYVYHIHNNNLFRVAAVGSVATEPNTKKKGFPRMRSHHENGEK